ncbi:chitin synthase-domain-containing protein [Fimicolochytrium jonesii]|uniref:chitin synthase-domain-containing protein n=1 Tax=Fimicolochytrium jonesii TaxID=1396493 RepID=UPI0022FE2F3A|nr:chitin synthase-domain-containing protein [Fimicolochytrium jonesii]KAI8823048.1 chitin synthase-domain-containing protein [Fimicolochytrium jonesii]
MTIVNGFRASRNLKLTPNKGGRRAKSGQNVLAVWDGSTMRWGKTARENQPAKSLLLGMRASVNPHNTAYTQYILLHYRALASSKTPSKTASGLPPRHLGGRLYWSFPAHPSISKSPTLVRRPVFAPRQDAWGRATNTEPVEDDIEQEWYTRSQRYQGPTPLLRSNTTKTGRSKRRQSTSNQPLDLGEDGGIHVWAYVAKALTCCFPPALLACCKINGSGPQQAWREKVALCWIVFLLSAFVMFFVIGLNPLLCPESARLQKAPRNQPDSLVINGIMYDLLLSPENVRLAFRDAKGADATDFFAPADPDPNNPDPCKDLKTGKYPFAATTIGPACLNSDTCFPRTGLVRFKTLRDRKTRVDEHAAYEWEEIVNRNFSMYMDTILDLTPYYRAAPPDPNNAIHKLLYSLRDKPNNDATRALVTSQAMSEDPRALKCLVNKFAAGVIAQQSVSCNASTVLSALMSVVVLGVLLARFAMAVFFDWFVSHRLAQTPEPEKLSRPMYPSSTSIHNPADRNPHRHDIELVPSPKHDGALVKKAAVQSFDSANIGLHLYTILLVTCYSEGRESLRNTLESLAATDYKDSRKLLFVIADGIITGKGNGKSTPDLLLDMIEIDGTFGNDPKPCSYIAVASGAKAHNMAKVYVGHFRHAGHRVPMVIVVKCGAPEEASEAKPGNRGKRDSQLILMHFFTRVMLNDRMTPLDYELFRKIQHVMGVTPDFFEIVLMVDADTKVAPDSLGLMINAMHNDASIMGLCGETRIENKTQSWVTAIQVFEYYISHHLGKAFESIFGGVTCLPGCFCMYRIKARKEFGDWVPILANPDVVETYSTNEVDTLHQKNLLLLGEDRFLTTMMLRTFPNRKMVFIPRAVCKTVVPDDFATLLSQRRRWINSTVHNLAELVLVNNLCGTFCFSMQFVVLLDLISTFVLPATVASMFYIIVFTGIQYAHSSIATGQIITIITLFVVTLFPAFVVLCSLRRFHYLFWMLLYIMAIPIWNLILPLYAFWHFDDFSWGATRQVDGVKEDTHGHGGDSGAGFDGSKVPLKRWEEYERQWRREKVEAYMRANPGAQSPQGQYSHNPWDSGRNGPLGGRGHRRSDSDSTGSSDISTMYERPGEPFAKNKLAVHSSEALLASPQRNPMSRPPGYKGGPQQQRHGTEPLLPYQQQRMMSNPSYAGTPPGSPSHGGGSPSASPRPQFPFPSQHYEQPRAGSVASFHSTNSATTLPIPPGLFRARESMPGPQSQGASTPPIQTSGSDLPVYISPHAPQRPNTPAKSKSHYEI